jgi:hypothetical protein
MSKSVSKGSLKPKNGWQHINWLKAKADLRQLQLAIVRAYNNKNLTEVRLAQVTHSKNNKLIAAWKVRGVIPDSK